MSYFVDRKVKGNYYRYQVTAYWDKDKQQSRQKNVYLGPKEKAETRKLKQLAAQLVSKSYGNIFFLDEISKSIGWLLSLSKYCLIL